MTEIQSIKATLPEMPIASAGLPGPLEAAGARAVELEGPLALQRTTDQHEGKQK